MSELSWAALRAVSSSPRPTRSPRLVRLLTLIAALLMAAAALPLLAAESSPEPQSEIQNPKSKIQNPPAWPGNPLAPGAIGLVEREIVGSLQERGVAQNFARYQSYASMKLDTTARPFTGNEVAGNCRLKWYDHMLRNVTRAPAEAEAFTRLLHYSLASDHRGLEQVLVTVREKMDLGRRLPRTFATVDSPDAALTGVEQAIAGAQVGYAKALATITRTELAELSRSLYPVLVSQNTVGHTLEDRGTGRRLCDLMEKMDRAGFYDAADALAPLADPGLLEQLANLPEAAVAAPAGVTGSIVRQIDTPAGPVIVGGRGPNTYHLDEMADVAAVIDLGGDDVYHEGTVSPERPVLVVIDLDGNDVYRGSQAGHPGRGDAGRLDADRRGGRRRLPGPGRGPGLGLCRRRHPRRLRRQRRYAGLRRVQGPGPGRAWASCIDRAGERPLPRRHVGPGLRRPAGLRRARRPRRRGPLLPRRPVPRFLPGNARLRRLGPGRGRRHPRRWPTAASA